MRPTLLHTSTFSTALHTSTFSTASPCPRACTSVVWVENGRGWSLATAAGSVSQWVSGDCASVAVQIGAPNFRVMYAPRASHVRGGQW